MRIRQLIHLYSKLNKNFNTMQSTNQVNSFSKNAWDQRANHYRKNTELFSFSPAATLGNMLEISKAKNIVEMACATGVFSLYYLKTFNNAETYISCDFSDKMIEIANGIKAETEGLSKNTKHEFRVANAEDLSFINDESQDVYIGNLCIHLITDADKALQEAKRILRKGGRIGLSVPVIEDGSLLALIFSSFREASKVIPEGRSPYYLSTPEALTKIVKDNGFEVVYVWDDCFRFPCSNIEEVDALLNGEDCGPMYMKFDEETRKEIRAKVVKGFEKMRAEFVAPYMKMLSIVATKP